MLVVFASHKIDSVVWFMLILYLCYCLGSNCWLKHKFACKDSSKNWRGAIAWQAALDINFPFITPSQLYQCCCLHSSTHCYALQIVQDVHAKFIVLATNIPLFCQFMCFNQLHFLMVLEQLHMHKWILVKNRYSAVPNLKMYIIQESDRSMQVWLYEDH